MPADPRPVWRIKKGTTRCTPSLKRHQLCKGQHIHAPSAFCWDGSTRGTLYDAFIQPVFPHGHGRGRRRGGGGAADQEAAHMSDSELTSHLHHQGPRGRRRRLGRRPHFYYSICILSSAVMKPFIRLSLRNKEWNLGNPRRYCSGSV